MNFQIPCEIFLRLANVPKYLRPTFTEEEKISLSCVRIEIRTGQLLAIASNRKIAAIYNLGEIDQPDGAVHLRLDPAVLAQCETEKPFNSTIQVIAIKELGVVTAKTMLGFNCPADFGYFLNEPTHLENWRIWPSADPITKTKGAMSWVMQDILSLNFASPSGHIAFPEFIDANKPVVLRDMNFDNWVGLFMPNRVDDNGKVYTAEPAALPEWW